LILHLLILWWLTGFLRLGPERLQTPFVVDLVRESEGPKADVPSGEDDAPRRQGNGPADAPQAMEAPVFPDASVPDPVAEDPVANPQDLTGDALVPPTPDQVLPERRERILDDFQRDLLSKNEIDVQTPSGDRPTSPRGAGGTLHALGSSAGITGPLGDRALLHIESPEYPEWARRQGIEASVTFRFWVSSDGDVIRIETNRRTAYPELESLGRESLLHWRFAPLPSGEIKEEWGEVSILWRLDAPGEAAETTRGGR
jgi:TonB family protein